MELDLYWFVVTGRGVNMLFFLEIVILFCINLELGINLEIVVLIVGVF